MRIRRLVETEKLGGKKAQILVMVSNIFNSSAQICSVNTEANFQGFENN